MYEWLRTTGTINMNKILAVNGKFNLTVDSCYLIKWRLGSCYIKIRESLDATENLKNLVDRNDVYTVDVFCEFYGIKRPSIDTSVISPRTNRVSLNAKHHKLYKFESEDAMIDDILMETI